MSDLTLLGEGDAFRDTACELIRKTEFFNDIAPGDIEYLSTWV